MWVVGINQTAVILVSQPASQGGYAFGELATGYLYFSPVIGVLVGEVAGHWGNDVSLDRRQHAAPCYQKAC